MLQRFTIALVSPPVGEREADVLLVLVVGVSGKGEAGERGGGEVNLSGRHHAATHAWLKFVASRKAKPANRQNMNKASPVFSPWKAK